MDNPPFRVHAARTPSGINLYAIGDIHGRLDLLDPLLQRLDEDRLEKGSTVSLEVFLGDYIDRGVDSRGVLNRLIERSQTGRTVCLAGNHEYYLLQALRDPASLKSWLHVGGGATLTSYGIKPPRLFDLRTMSAIVADFMQALPLSHYEFLAGLPQTFVCGDYLFAHAGMRPGVALMDQTVQDHLMIRGAFLNAQDAFGRIVVHGHTPVEEPVFLENRINIDTGAYATGRLTCLVLEGETSRILRA